ncbi:MAG: glutamate ligase domain-containing protein [Bdellovibrio bacteriovorus]
MDIQRVRLLQGPNLWSDEPVAELWLDLSTLTMEELPGLQDRVRAGLVALFGRRCPPRAGSAQDRSSRCLWLARALARILGELCARLDRSPRLLLTRPGPGANQYRIALDLDQDASVPEPLAAGALRILRALGAGATCDLPGELEALRAAARDSCPSTSAGALLAAARARGIPARRLGRDLLHLGQGHRQRRLFNTRSDRAGPLGDWAAGDRDLLRQLLACAGVPCAREPATQEHFRALVAGGQLAAILRWSPGPQGNGQGGSAADVSGLVHPQVAARVRDAAAALGLDVAEVRLVADDIAQPLETQGGQVTEVIPAPALDPFLEAAPTAPVAELVLEALFPVGETGRIPVIAVTGTNGKTTVTRLLAHAYALRGRFVGMTCTDGIFLGGRCIDTDDCSGPQSARLVLMGHQVEVAVLETARGGILREGLGFDLCDLAVVTNIGEGDHLGLGGVETPQRLAEVKQTLVRAVAPWGTAVLNAADPLVAPMADRCRGRVLFFARDGGQPRLLAHRRAGGRVAFVRDQGLVLAEGAMELPPIPMHRIPLTLGGRIGFQVENALACAGAMWAMGLPLEAITLALETFGGDLDHSPGRFNVLEMGGATVVFDYGHNPSALLAMIDALGHFPQRRRLAVYSAAGDRRDADMIRQGEILGEAFDQVILYEDHYLRSRQPGEIMALFRQGLAAGQRVRGVQSIHGWREAVDASLWQIEPGDLLLVQADRIDETVAYVRERLAADQAIGALPLTRAARAGTALAEVLPVLAQA